MAELDTKEPANDKFAKRVPWTAGCQKVAAKTGFLKQIGLESKTHFFATKKPCFSIPGGTRRIPAARSARTTNPLCPYSSLMSSFRHQRFATCSIALVLQLLIHPLALGMPCICADSVDQGCCCSPESATDCCRPAKKMLQANCCCQAVTPCDCDCQCECLPEDDAPAVSNETTFLRELITVNGLVTTDPIDLDQAIQFHARQSSRFCPAPVASFQQLLCVWRE